MLLTGGGCQPAPGDRSPETGWPAPQTWRHTSLEKQQWSWAEGGRELAYKRGRHKTEHSLKVILPDTRASTLLLPSQWHEKQHYLESSKHVAHHNRDHNQVGSGHRSSKLRLSSVISDCSHWLGQPPPPSCPFSDLKTRLGLC